MYGPKGNKGDKVLNLNSVVVALRVLTYLESVFVFFLLENSLLV